MAITVRLLGLRALAFGGLRASERSRLKAAAIKKYLKPGVIRDLD
jgi:hypothetical protein